MVKITYSIYSFYTLDNKIYIGMTGKNPEVRIQQHKYRSCNFRLQKLLDDPNTQIFSEVLYTGLKQEEASLLEKKLIKQYRDNPNYQILNIQSGGLRGNNKIVKVPKISKSSRLSDDDIKRMRLKFSRRKYKINADLESKKYNICKKYFMAILRGTARQRAEGPLLERDYNNGKNGSIFGRIA